MSHAPSQPTRVRSRSLITMPRRATRPISRNSTHGVRPASRWWTTSDAWAMSNDPSGNGSPRPSATRSSRPSVVAIRGFATTAAERTSGRESTATTRRWRPRARDRSMSATGMSAPPVPTSIIVSSSRCAASASMAAAERSTPPRRRLIRARSRRLPARATWSSSGPSSSSTASERRSIPPQATRREGAHAQGRARVSTTSLTNRPGSGSGLVMPTMRSMIVVAGESLIDRLVAPDGAIVEVPGGGPFNTARTVARLGHARRVPGLYFD